MTAKQIGTAILAIRPAAGAVVEIGTLLAGGALVSYGAWEIYRPAGPIVAGVLLIAGVILSARGS